ICHGRTGPRPVRRVKRPHMEPPGLRLRQKAPTRRGRNLEGAVIGVAPDGVIAGPVNFIGLLGPAVGLRYYSVLLQSSRNCTNSFLSFSARRNPYAPNPIPISANVCAII